MNLVLQKGRPTKDPEITYSADQKAIAKFTLAVNGIGDRVDFPSCVAFGKTAELIERSVKKGTEIITQGSIKTGSYTNKEGKKVYTTDVIVDRIEFCGKKEETSAREELEKHISDFMTIPDDIDKDLPFN